MITLTNTIICKSSLSLSINHRSHMFNKTFESNPLLISSPLISKCSCYSCCYYYSSISVCNRLAPININPSFLCKKLIFSGNNFRVLSFYDVDRSYYYEKLCDFKERRKYGKRGFRYNRKKQFSSNVSDDCGNDVEVMLSLLSGEVGSGYLDVRDWKKIDKGKKNEVKFRALAKRKNLDLRKEGCYGEREDEKEFEVKCDGGQTFSIEYKNDLKRDCKSCIDEVDGNIEKQEECAEERGKLLEEEDILKGNYGKSIGVSRDWRKTSEKELNEEYKDEVDKDTDELGSRMKYKRITEMSNNDKSFIELDSRAEKKLKPISEVSESRIKTSTEVNDKIKNTREEKHHNENEKSELIHEISDTRFTNSENTSISHRKEFRTAKQKQYSPVGVTKGKKTIIEDNIPSSEMLSVEEGCGPKGGGSRHSSQGSGPKGPSDEMWHVTDASTQDSSETDAPEPDNISDLSENGEAVKTSSKSFWTVIGDVVRLNWKSPWSEPHTPNSGSETRFSSTKGLDSPLRSSNNNSGPSISTSLPIIKESCGIKKTLDTGETVKSGNDSKNGELKRRKLVDKDQVSKDRFDEWEDAYNLENEQRKNDELFMREALLEAKKAADVWEVPVGAVLVKGGKIIARGYNLVEELRDSTAHAEMICIRKASTNLQSWRLLDTTLYVTLEPCPMCAGAILQARIDTVVWGAPNKLLGADGSWIRLFCDGDGGNDSMPTDKPAAPAHPFHPNMVVRRGVLAAECSEVMKSFFRLRRKMKTEPRRETEPEPEPEPPTPPSSIIVSHHHHRDHSDFFSKMQHVFKIIFCL